MMTALVVLAATLLAGSVVGMRMSLDENVLGENVRNVLLGSVLFTLWSIAVLLAAILLTLNQVP